MAEASSLLEKIQFPIGYRKTSPNPSLVDGMVNLVPSLVSPVDQVVNLVSSLVEPLTKVAEPVPSLIIPTLHRKSEPKVTDPVPSLVSPTLHLKSAKVVSPVTSSVNPTPPLKSANVANPTPPLTSAKVVALVPSSVNLVDHAVNLVKSLVQPVDKVVDPFPHINPFLPLENKSQVVNLMPLSINPTLPLESKPDSTLVFLVDKKSTVMGGIPHSPMKPPPSNEAILFYLGALTGPHLPSHIPFKITVKVCGWDIPRALIDEGSSISILSSIAWQDLGYPQLVLVTQTLFSFNRRTIHPLGILP
jgi:hypothetical protein